MSLDQRFFEERERAISRSELRGYEEIESFVERHKLSMDDLTVRGLIESERPDTATIFCYFVTEEGKKYLAQSKHHQFIAVRPGQKDALLDYIDGLV